VFDPVQKKFDFVRLNNRAAKPMGIIAASDGNIWFTQQGANLISRVSQQELKEEKNGSF
jgi:streptogramin lyase